MLVSEFEGRRVGILGAGREGRAVWRYIQNRLPGQRVTVFSESPVDAELSTELSELGHELSVGPLDASRLASFDILVRSPGISPYREELIGLGSARMTTASSIWFTENPSARTICITGTKGKSTTTALTTHLLCAAGCNAVSAGNIGQPMLELDSAGVDWWVTELSSYQICDLDAQPTIGAILNLAEEHLDWHGGRDAYRRDKMRLASLASSGRLVANWADDDLREALSGHGDVSWFNRAGGWSVDGDAVTRSGGDESYHLARLPGGHNLANLAAALTLAELAHALPVDVQASLDGFQGLPHRLFTIGEVEGLRFVDDSLSTTPQAVLAALEAHAGLPVTLLVGGLDRGLDWFDASHRIQALNPYSVIALPDNGPHILEMLARARLDAQGGMHAVRGMDEAVAKAREITPRGGVVLLSPGAPSFPHFRDYRERGQAFARAAGIKKETAGQG